MQAQQSPKFDTTHGRTPLAGAAALPSLQPVVGQLIALLQMQDVSAGDAAMVLEGDADLAGKLLRYVNSAALGLKQKVTTLHHAVAMLGFDSLRRIVLSASVYENVIGVRREGPLDRQRFWRHCLAVAAVSQTLATQVDQASPEEAYVAGLLHDLGKIVLDRDEARFREASRLLEEHPVAACEAERRVLGSDHADIGGNIVDHWGLSLAVCEGVRFHHSGEPPETASVRGARLAAIVQVADALAWGQGMGSTRALRPPVASAWARAVVSVDRIDHDRVADEIEHELVQMRELFPGSIPEPRGDRQALQEANMELARVRTLYEETRQRLELGVTDLAQVVEGVRSLWRCQDAAQVRETLLSAAHDGLRLQRAIVYEIDADLDCIHLLERGCRRGPGEGGSPPGEVALPHDDRFVSQFRAARSPFTLKPPHSFRSLGEGDVVVAPIVALDEPTALLIVQTSVGSGIAGGARISLLGTLTAEAGRVLESLLRMAQTREQAAHDELTDLYNRRHLLEALTREVERARRYHRPLSAVMCDLDGFKRINDTFGHPAGDRVLRGVASEIVRTSREADIVGRYGGDEFLVLLPETEHDGSAQYAERLRQGIENLGARLGEAHPALGLSASLGAAAFDPEDPDPSRLVEHADRALYAAKQLGRNRVCSYRNL